MLRIIKSALMSSLDQYMAKPEPAPPPRPRQDPKAQLNFRPSIPQELAESYFVGASYDGERRAVYLKLYEPNPRRYTSGTTTQAIPRTASPRSCQKLWGRTRVS